MKRRNEEKETNVEPVNNQSAFLQNYEQISAKPVPKAEFFETGITNIRADASGESEPIKKLKRQRVSKSESMSLGEIAFRLIFASICESKYYYSYIASTKQTV